MKTIRQAIYAIAAMLAVLAGPRLAAQSEDGIKRLALQISDNDPSTFNKALNVAANFAREMSAAGEMYEIEIVAFNAGLHMLRSDTSPVMDRIASISQSIPEVTFTACGNTIAGMTRTEGKAPPITEHAGVVPAGVGRLMELDDQNYFVMRP